jgi:hypothetical protein
MRKSIKGKDVNRKEENRMVRIGKEVRLKR